MSIVVIDDSSIARDALTHLLSRNGFVVHPALVCEMSGDAANSERILFTGQGVLARALKADPSARCEYVDIPLRGDSILRSIASHRNGPVDRTPADRQTASDFIAASPKMRTLVESIRRVARSDSPVLITGESGTGKDVVAREIARLGVHRRGGFVPVNCGAVAESVVDSELFGHIKGSFTDAVSDRKGLIESADGGVLFLDEIGEMPLSAQIKLLRFLDSGEFRRVGDSEVRRADVRVIAATNRNLERAIAERTFRLDLFYRLCVVALHVPALRERRVDIPAMVDQHLRRMATLTRTSVRAVSDDAMAVLVDAPWPGNVRELQNVVERVIMIATGDTITEDEVRVALAQYLGNRESPLFTDSAEQRHLIETALGQFRRNQTQAAAALGISRTTLWRRRRRLELRGEL